MPRLAPPDTPVVLWRTETHKAPSGVYVRVHVYLNEATGDPVVLCETSTSLAGPWAQMGRVE